MSDKSGFRDLIAWQKAHELASAVYRLCDHLPPRAAWLRDQILRCAISVPANIAEGHGRGTKAELLRFIDIARGSLSELEYYLYFLAQQGLLTEEDVQALEAKRSEAARVLFGLWRSLKSLNKNDWDHTGRVREEGPIYQLN